MFTYVYHEYGALRLDGWGKLAEEIGELYYFTVARTYIWGGLYELNYEYSPMEALDGIENTAEEHYYPFDPRGYAFRRSGPSIWRCMHGFGPERRRRTGRMGPCFGPSPSTARRLL